MIAPRRPDLDRLLEGGRAELARAITLVESTRPDDRLAARDLLAALKPQAGTAVRVGVTGVPGAGKSTFIDALGSGLIRRGHRVAVLAVDPSSSRTGGAILGDKTRMARLATDPSAFVRPTASGGSLGGVAARTREATLLCEAAGYDVVLVETVGVGQSETAVADLTDFFLVLALPGAGDELQGIKKGVIELADAVAVNKADGDGAGRAGAAAGDYRAALQILAEPGSSWRVPVLLVSGLFEQGLDEVWDTVLRHRDVHLASGEFANKRKRQDIGWMWALVDERWRSSLNGDPRLKGEVSAIEKAVGDGSLSPGAGADAVASLLGI